MMSKSINIAIVVAVIAVVGVLAYFLLRNIEVDQSTSPTPTAGLKLSFNEASSGCRNIFVYKTNQNNTMGISVSASKDFLDLSSTEKIFEVGKTYGLEVEILTGTNIKQHYCSDFTSPDQAKTNKLIGRGGLVIISTTPPDREGVYEANLILRNVSFYDENGNKSEIFIDELIFKNVPVGSLPG